MGGPARPVAGGLSTKRRAGGSDDIKRAGHEHEVVPFGERQGTLERFGGRLGLLGHKPQALRRLHDAFGVLGTGRAAAGRLRRRLCARGQGPPTAPQDRAREGIP